MHKIMILPACLGIFLVGIIMIPGVFAADGCGTGTVLVDGVCQLAPQESNDGCGLYATREQISDIRDRLNQREFTKEDKQYDYLEWWQKSKKDK